MSYTLTKHVSYWRGFLLFWWETCNGIVWRRNMSRIQLVCTFAFLVSFQFIPGDNILTVSLLLKSVVFESICLENVFTNSAIFISTAYKVRNKIMCGIQCFDTPNWVLFAFIEDGRCWLYSSRNLIIAKHARRKIVIMENCHS
jgi:hypothetical protein